MTFFMVLIPVFLLIGLVLIVIFTKNMKRTRLKKKFHRNFIFGYLLLLLLGLVVAEVMERKVEHQNPPKVNVEDVEFDLPAAIVEGTPIPEKIVLSKRTHKVKGELVISSFTNAYLLIERTPDNSHTITETVYSPELMANIGEENNVYYDVTDQLETALPIWESNLMTVPKQPLNNIQYTFYHDSNILNQFTGEKTYGYSSGSVSSAMTIHLIVPESIVLKLPEVENEYGTYIDVIE